MLLKAFNNTSAYGAMSVAHKEKLIELVKMNPGLWKESRKAPGLKQIIWNDIGAELNTTGYDARRQWEILRDQLRRENKRFKQKPNYKSKWMFFTKMLFALPQNNSPASVSVCTDDGEQYYTRAHQKQQIMQNENYITPKIEGEQPIIQVRKDLQEGNNDDSINHLSAADGNFTGPVTTPRVVVATAPTTVDDMVEDYYPSTSAGAGVSSSTQLHQYTKDADHCDSKQTLNKRYPNCPPSEVEDEDYYFAISLVPSFRCIPRSKKLRLRSKIMDLIADALESDYEEDNKVYLTKDVREAIEFEEEIIPDQIVQTSMEKN